MSARAMSKIIRPICDELNNHLLVPMNSKALIITEEDNHVIMKIKGTDDKFVAPKTDCALLPIEHSSCEDISDYIG